MDRLTLPKRIPVPTESPYKKPLAVPPDPLPTWLSLPLEAKLPMVPAPKGAVVLYTTNLGEKIHKSTRDLDFDMTDPNFLLMSNEYKPLHDPHLKPLLSTPALRRRLYRAGFITRDGKVLCTLKEFNDYRQYLRKMHQRYIDQERKEKSLELTKEREEGAGGPATHIAKKREEKAREVRDRLHKQHEAAKARYEALMEATEERRKRLREERSCLLGRFESKYQMEQARRYSQIKRKQNEERKRKLVMLRKWMDEDHRRRSLAEERRRQKDMERQKKLEESWEQRKHVQRQRLEEEQFKRDEAEAQKQKTIREREKQIQRKWKRQQKIFQELSNFRRKEKEKMEWEHALKFAMKMQALESRYQAPRKGKKHKRRLTRSPAFGRSTWDIEQSLRTSLTPVPFTLSDQRAKTWNYITSYEMLEIKDSATKLGMSDFRGANFTADVIEAAQLEEEKDVDNILETVDLGQFHGASINNTITKRKMDKQQRMKKAQSILAKIGLGEFRGAKMNPKLEISRKRPRKRKIKIKRLKSAEERAEFPDEEEEDFMMDEESEDGGLQESHTDEELQAAAAHVVSYVVDIVSKIIYPAMETYMKEEGITDEKSILYQGTSGGDEWSLDSRTTDGTVIGVIHHEGGRFPEGVKFSLTPHVTYYMDDWSNSDIYSEDRFGRDPEPKSDDAAMHTDEGLEEDEEEEFSKTALSVKDSLELVMCKSSHSKELAVTNLTQLLQRILNELSSGALSFEKVAKLSNFMKDLFQDEAISSPVKSLPLKSSISDLASGVVRDVINRVQEHLFQEESGGQFQVITQMPSQTSGMADFIVTNTLQRVVADLGSKDKVTNAALKSSSETLMFIMDVIRNVAQEMMNEKMDRSETSMFIQSVIQEVINDVKKNKLPIAKGPRRESTTETEVSDYVHDVLNRVTSLVRKDRRILKRCKSLTSLFIHDVLQKVAMETLNDYEYAQKQSTTSLLAGSLVSTTIDKCLTELESGKMTSDGLRNLTTSIVTSCTSVNENIYPDDVANQDTASLLSLQSWSGMISPPYMSDNSEMVNTLVWKTLNKVCDDVKSGRMNRQDVNQMAKSLSNTVDEEEKPQFSSVKNLFSRSKTSIAASAYVTDTLEKVMRNLHNSEDVHSENASPSSNALGDFVSDVLAKIMNEINKNKESDTDAMMVSIKESFDSLLSLPNSPFSSSISIGDNESVLRTVSASPELEDDMNDEIPVLAVEERSSEVEITPVVDGKEIHLNPELVGHALCAISMKTVHSHLNPNAADARHSFRNLIHPDIAKIKSLHTESEATLNNQLEQVSAMNMSQPGPSNQRGLDKTSMVMAAEPQRHDSVDHVVTVTNIKHSHYDMAGQSHFNTTHDPVTPSTSAVIHPVKKSEIVLKSSTSKGSKISSDAINVSKTNTTESKIEHTAASSHRKSSQTDFAPTKKSSSSMSQDKTHPVRNTSSEIASKSKASKHDNSTISKDKMSSIDSNINTTSKLEKPSSESMNKLSRTPSNKLTKQSSSSSKCGYAASTASSRSKMISTTPSADLVPSSQSSPQKPVTSTEYPKSARKQSKTSTSSAKDQASNANIPNNSKECIKKSSRASVNAREVLTDVEFVDEYSASKAVKVEVEMPSENRSLCDSDTMLTRVTSSPEIEETISNNSFKHRARKVSKSSLRNPSSSSVNSKGSFPSDSSLDGRPKRSSPKMTSSGTIVEMRSTASGSARKSRSHLSSTASSERTCAPSGAGSGNKRSSDMPPVRPSSGFRPSNTSMRKPSRTSVSSAPVPSPRSSVESMKQTTGSVSSRQSLPTTDEQ